MVAYVSGNSLGWINGSAGVLGSAGQVGNASTGNTGENVLVNAATGNLIISHRDEYLSGLGLDLPILRTYNSQGLLNDDNGDNWRLGYSRTVSALTGTANTAGTVTRTGEDGAAIVYTFDATSGKYVSDAGSGARDTLSYDTGTDSWTWTDGDTQTTERYASIVSGGQLQSITDHNGNTVTLTWTGNLLTRITNADGEYVSFIYDTTAGHTANLVQVSTYAKTNPSDANAVLQSRVSYHYDGNNRLDTVTVDLTPANTTDSVVYTTSYTYDGASDRVASVTQTDGSQLKFYYDQTTYRLTSIDDVRSSTDVRTTTLTYGANQTTTITTTARNPVTNVTSPLTQSVTMQYDAITGQLKKLTQPGIGDTVYTYDANGNVTQVTDPKGNITVYGYDSQNNRNYERDAAGNTISRTYSSTNQLLIETRYRVADPDGAGSQTASLPATTHYAYDAKGNLRFAVSPEGRVTEYRYDTHGLLKNQISYTGAQFTGTTFDEATLSTWGGQQDLTQTQRIDTCYDFRGQVSKVIRYAIVKADGTGTADGTQSSTAFVYDAWGELLQTVDPRGVATTGTTGAAASDYVTTYTYDGMGRVLTQTRTDANGVALTLSSTAYNDPLRQSTFTLRNPATNALIGASTVTTYDQAGHPVSVVQTDNSTGTEMSHIDYVVDVLGRTVAKRITTSTAGSPLSSYVLYDANNRKVADIDATGALTEYIYSADSQIVETIAYASPVSASALSGDPTAFTLSGANGLRPASTANDRVTRSLYDAAGRLVKTIDPDGAVTQYQYDGRGQLTQTTQFANRLTGTQLSALAATNGDIAPTNANTVPVSDVTNDRTTRNFYSDDGLLLGTLDAEGYLTEYRYDGSGQRVQSVKYATVTNASIRGTATDISQLRPAANASDITTTVLYNDEGQVTGTIDGEGYLTETQYDAAGNVAATIRYANKVTTTSVIGATVAGVRPATSSTDHQVISQYDALNRITQTQSLPDNLVTTYQYDLAGNLISTSSGTAPRQDLKRYDALGRVTAELSGENAARITVGMTQAQIDAVWGSYATKYTYDEGGALTSVTDEIGRKTLYYYDNDGRLAYTINAKGEVSYTKYDAFGGKTEFWRYAARLSATTLAGLTGGYQTAALTNAINGISGSGILKTSQTYTLRGQIANAFDAYARNTDQYTYNAFGEAATHTTLLDAVANTTRQDKFTYDRRGLLTQEQDDASGINATTTHQYDAFGRVIKTGPTGIITSTSYDHLGRVLTTSTGSTAGSSTIENKQYTYDAFSRTLTLTTSDGTTVYAYDDTNRKLTVTTPLGISTSQTHDEFGETIAVTDGRGNTTTYHYTKDGQVDTVTDPAGNVTTTYDPAGQVSQTTDKNGIVTTYTYDAAGRVLTRTVDPTGLNITTRTCYDALGEAIWQQDGNGIWTRTDYDKNGRVTMVEVDPARSPSWTTGADDNPNGLAIKTTYAYDAAGELITLTEGAGSANPKVTQYTYDKLGRRTKDVVNPGGLAITNSYVYDAAGKLVQKTDPNGNKSYYGYDVYGRLTVTVDPAGSVTQTVYDNLDRVTQIRQYKDALTTTALATLPAIASNGTRKDSDVLALLPNGAANTNYVVTQTLYNADGQKLYAIDAAGDVTRYDYDAAGNLILQTRYATALTNLSAGASVSTLQAALVIDSAHDAVTRYVYDTANRLIWSIDPEGNAVRRSYDANGNAIRVRSLFTPLTAAQIASLPAVPSVTNIDNLITYSNSDRIARTVYDAAGRVQYAIDPAGGVTYTAYDKDGNVTYTRAYVTALTFAQRAALTNGVIQPSEITAVLVSSANDRVTRTVYDAAGRAVWNIDANGDATRMTYDGSGNVAKVQAFAKPLNATQLGSLAIVENVAHLDGMFTSDAVNDHITRYAYDAAQRLVWSIDPEGNAVRRSYDANGNVVRSRAFSTPVTAAQLATLSATPSVTDITNVVASTSSDRVTRTLYYADNSVQYAIDAAGDVTYYTYDALGNAISTTAYATPLTSAQLSALTNGVVQPSEVTAVLVTGSNDHVTQNVYDNAGRLNYTVDALNFVTANSYDAFGRVKTTTRYATALTSTPAMTMAGLSAAVGAIANTVKDETDTFVYDRAGRLASSRDALQQTELYSYDGLGNKISFTNKKGSVWNYQYDNDGRLTQETSPTVTTTTTSDVNGKVTAATAVSSAIVTQMAYDALGNLLSRTELAQKVNADGTLGPVLQTRITTYQYDNLGRQTRTTFPKVAIYDAATDAASNYSALTGAGESGNVGRVEITRDPSPLSGPANANPLFSQVFYDAFGNAVANIDVSGNISLKSYDRLGHVKYDVDAMGYVTQYDHDAFGGVTALTRYATATSLIPSSISDAAGVPSATAISTAVQADITNGNYRLLSTQYDALGRAIAVTEPSSYVWDPDTGTAGVGTYFTLGKQTKTAYDAFGNTIRVDVLKAPSVNSNPAVWTTTRQYFDKLNRQTATVDALNYVKENTYDANGNLTATTEYANAISAANLVNITDTSYPRPAADANGKDRTTTYGYDQLNRKVCQTRVGIQYSTASDGTSTTGNVTTKYGYDAVGNQTYTTEGLTATDTVGATTYSYYDALGRITAVAAPARCIGSSTVATSPLTVFQRDAYGNVVVKTDYANGVTITASTTPTTIAPGTTPAVTADPANDRTTYTLYDAMGHAIETTEDVTTNKSYTQYSSYDAAGHLAKHWYQVTDNNTVANTSTLHTLFTVYQYDKLGRQIGVVTPAVNATFSPNQGLNVSFTSSTGTEHANSGPTFNGTNSIKVVWNNGFVDSAGGQVKVDVTYMKGFSNWGSATVSQTAGAASAATGMAITWNDNYSQGGISSLSTITISQQNSSGQWVTKWTGPASQAAGSQIATQNQTNAGVLVTQSAYNGFGEMTSQQLSTVTPTATTSETAQTWEYDSAGRVWRTNSGDGVTKVMLYDLQGHVVSQIVSAGVQYAGTNQASATTNPGFNLMSMHSAQETVSTIQITPSLVSRNDSYYDALGRQTKQVQAARNDVDGGVTVKRSYLFANSQNTVDSTKAASYNSATLSWTPVDSLSGGDARVVMQYTKANGTTGTKTVLLTNGQAQSGATFSWTDDSFAAISSITRVTVYKVDYDGNEQPVIDRTQFGYNNDLTVDIGDPDDSPDQDVANTSVVLKYQLNGGAWTTVVPKRFGDAWRATLANAGGNYAYEVWTTRPGQAAVKSASGSFSLAAPVEQAITTTSIALGNGGTGASILSWKTPGAGITQTFNYRPTGSTGAWTSLPVSSRVNGYDGVDIGTLSPTDYDYELLWTDTTKDVAPYAHARGTFTVNPPPITGITTTNSSSGATLQWSSPTASGTATLLYRLPNATTWTTLTATQTQTYPPGYNGAGSGGGATYTQTFNLASIPAGTYVAVIHFNAGGGGSTTAAASGSLTIGGVTQVWVPGTTGTTTLSMTSQSAGTSNVSLSGNTLKWQHSNSAGSGTATVWYRVHGTSTWSTVTATTDAVNNPMGPPSAWIYTATMPSLANGTYDIQLNSPSGVDGSGTLTASGGTAGYYKNVSTTASYTDSTTIYNSTPMSNPGTAIVSLPAGSVLALSQSTPNNGSVAQRPVITQTLDRWGNVLSITDPRVVSWKTQYLYNANNQMIEELQMDANGAIGGGPNSFWYYDAFGNQVATRDARKDYSSDGVNVTSLVKQNGDVGNVNGYVYDKGGNLIQENHADGGTVKHQYDAFGDEVAQTVKQNSSNSNTTTYFYDKLGRRTKVTYDAVRVYGADSNDQVTELYTTPQQLSEYMTYDQAGHLLTKTATDGKVTTYRYDSHGNVILTTVNGIGSYDAWDNHNRKIAEIDPNGLKQTWTYDAFHLLTHGNLGGDTLRYSYDNAGRLYWQHSDNGQNQSYAYDGAGQLIRIWDAAINQLTTYAYDLAGNHVRERTSQNGVVYQDDHLGYDLLGRLRYVGNDSATLRIDYDVAGNRTHIQTHRYLNGLDASGNYQNDNADRWFRYDAMNRQTLVDGTSTYAITATQGHQIKYDFAGDRVSDTHIGDRWALLHTSTGTDPSNVTEYGPKSGQTVIETYDYDALYRLTTITRNDNASTSDGSGSTVIDTRFYDAGGRVVKSGANIASNYAIGLKLDADTHVSRYDALGHLIHQGAYKASGYRDYTTDYTQIDAAGNTLSYTNTVFDNSNAYSYSTTTTIGYKRFEGYKESQESMTGNASGGSSITPGTTTSSYDIDGNLVSVSDSLQSANNRTFINDSQGNALYVNQGGHYQRQLIVDGQVLGRYGEQVDKPGSFSVDSSGNSTYTAPTFVDKSDFNFGYQPINGNYPGPAPGVYRVQNGDTLQSIALGAFGDSSLWYVIAEANGIEGNSDLRIGQSLTIPNNVGTVHNSSGTFKPYDASAIRGSTSPSLKVIPPPPPSDGGCGALGMIISTIVVAVCTAIGGMFGPLGAMLGNAIGQEFCVLIGAQDSIDWVGVAMAGIGEGLNEGLSDVNFTGEIGKNALNSTGNVMARAAVSNAMTQGIAVVAGVQDNFNWLSVAASAAGAGIGHEIGVSLLGEQGTSGYLKTDFAQALGGGPAAKLIGNTISGMAGGLTTAIVRGGKIDFASIAADAFGNALGQSVVDAIKTSRQEDKKLTAEDKAKKRADELQAMSDEERKKVVAEVLARKLRDPFHFVISDSSTDSEVAQAKLRTAYGDDLKMSDTSLLSDGMKYLADKATAIKDGISDDIDRLKFTIQDKLNGADDYEDTLRREMLESQRIVRQRVADLRAQGVLDDGLSCSALGPVGSRNNPGAATLEGPNQAYDNSYEQQQARNLNEGLQIAAVGVATDFVAAPILARGSKLASFFVSDETQATWALRNEFKLGLNADLPSFTPMEGTSPFSVAASRSFPARALTEDEFSALRFDPDKGKETVGAVEEIRAAQAAQREGLINAGAITRGANGADLNVAGADVSIKAYKDDSIIANPRNLNKLVGTLNADSDMQLLLDTRALTEEQTANITSTLTKKGIDPNRILAPSPKSYKPITVVGPDGKVKTY